MTIFDVVFIGAGISGISASGHLKKYCPNKSFLIFELSNNVIGSGATAMLIAPELAKAAKTVTML